MSVLILHGAWDPALLSLAVLGWSDWLDGHLARRYRHTSVLGTYLDPLADKALVACTGAALAGTGLLPAYAAAAFIARDAFLLSGAAYLRARQLRLAHPRAPLSLRAFLHGLSDVSADTNTNTVTDSTVTDSTHTHTHTHTHTESSPLPGRRPSPSSSSTASSTTTSSAATPSASPPSPPSPPPRLAPVHPLWISKVNTVLQLGVGATALALGATLDLDLATTTAAAATTAAATTTATAVPLLDLDLDLHLGVNLDLSGSVAGMFIRDTLGWSAEDLRDAVSSMAAVATGTTGLSAAAYALRARSHF